MNQGTSQRQAAPRWIFAVLALLLAVPLAVVMAGPVSAHTKLVSSNPAEGAALDSAPTQVVLTFNEEPTSITSVKAQDTDGPVVALGEPVLDGTTVTVSWPQDQAPGLFRLVYVLVSDDGDPVEGTLLFSYADGAAASGAAAPSTSVSAIAALVEEDSAMGRTWLVGVVLVLLAALGVLLASRRRRGAREVSVVSRSNDPADESSVV